jgi:hypothetical protein
LLAAVSQAAAARVRGGFDLTTQARLLESYYREACGTRLPGKISTAALEP